MADSPLSLQFSAQASIQEYLGDGELVAFNVGPDGDIYLVIARQPIDYRTTFAGGATFAKTVPERPQSYRVIGISRSQPVLDMTIQNEPFNIHLVQPLRDEILLVCTRSHYRGPSDFERNGRVYSRNGVFEREILLGDGISSVQTTMDGVIWTSYFDEGIFGNCGWVFPVGESGLVAWDDRGNKLYEFEPTRGLDSICDCYALNVETAADIWLYYYMDFPLVHLQSGEIQANWNVPVAGSRAFAIDGSHALFCGDYSDPHTYHLVTLGDEQSAHCIAHFNLVDEDGNKIETGWVVGRGKCFHLMSNGRIYQFDVSSAVNSQR